MSCWCGQDRAGYDKHMRRKIRTEPCDESRAANAAYKREWLDRPDNRADVNAEKRYYRKMRRR